MIARVFPRKTKASPDDDLAFFGPLPRKFDREVDEVHVSVTFTYDIPKAEELAKSWARLNVPVSIGGPAYGDRGGVFVPGRYLKTGYTFTSRGCPNHCWFCSVWRDVDGLRELEIKDGWIICDDNILATSEKHFRAVMEMLKRQPHRPRFVGGIEAKILQPWQAELIRSVKPQVLYCAYDTPDDYEPLVEAGKLFHAAGFSENTHALACYVLIGYKTDTFEKAEKRLVDTVKAGFMPFAMLYRDKQGQVDPTWRRFQRTWANPTIVGARIKQIKGE